MTRLQQIRTPAKEESGKKLRAFTILTTLLVACIVFSSVLLLNGNNKLRLLDQYIREVPVIVRDREQELETRAHVFHRLQPDPVLALRLNAQRQKTQHGG